jgi:hypothetical protein
MIWKWWTYNKLGRNIVIISRYYPRLEGVRKPTWNHDYDRQCSGWESNRRLLEYESEALPGYRLSWLTFFVFCFSVFRQTLAEYLKICHDHFHFILNSLFNKYYSNLTLVIYMLSLNNLWTYWPFLFIVFVILSSHSTLHSVCVWCSIVK